jgi:phosphoserine phosphatase RsbU/P
MNDEQRNFRSDQPKAETELSADQHKAEKLAIENKMLRFVLDSIPDNISIKDLEGRYIFDNRSHCLFLGATNTEDVVGKTLFDFLPPRIAAKFHAEDLRILRSGEAVVQSVDESINRSGNSVWMSVTKMSLRDDKGELMGLVSTTRDITARKKAEEQLAKYAEELREKNAQLEQDLETARELQNALLPQKYPRFPRSALPEASALRFHHFFRPSSSVGGDFFQVFQLSDSAAGVLICDVMGHGVRAALVAMILHTLVEDLRVHTTDPAKFLQELNRGISRILKHTHLSLYRHCICWPTLPVANCTMQMRDTRPRFGFTGSGEALSRFLFTDRSPIRCSGSLVTQNTTARLVSCALETYCCFLPTGFSRSKGPMSITTISSSC